MSLNKPCVSSAPCGVGQVTQQTGINKSLDDLHKALAYLDQAWLEHYEKIHPFLIGEAGAASASIPAPSDTCLSDVNQFIVNMIAKIYSLGGAIKNITASVDLAS
jgi:hypothetical protein